MPCGPGWRPCEHGIDAADVSDRGGGDGDRPLFLSTPVVRSEAPDRVLGRSLALKPETLRVEAMRAFGGEVRLEGRDFDAAKGEVYALH